MPRILVIEDDDVTAREIAGELTTHGIDVDCIGDGGEGLLRGADSCYDAIILDMMLPGMDGLSVVTQLRAQSVATPVLMISALCDVDERVRDLCAGGDDYQTKPFAPDEMLARVEVLLRRHRPHSPQTVLSVADLELDLVRHVARRAEKGMLLQPTEFKLLEFLMRHAGQLLTRTMIF